MSNDPWQTTQGELEKKWRNEISKVQSPAAFLATLLKKQIGDPIRRQNMVRDLLKIAEGCGRQDDKEYLTRLVEDEMRARKELRDMDKGKDPNNLNDWFPRNKDGKGMSTLSTAIDEEKKRIEQAAAQAPAAQASFDESTNETPNPDAEGALKSPFAKGELHWTHDAKKIQALHDALLVAHKERGFPDQKSDVEKGLRDYLDSMELVSITDYKGSGQELKKGYLDYMEERLPKAPKGSGAKAPAQAQSKPQSAPPPQQDAIITMPPMVPTPELTAWQIERQQATTFVQSGLLPFAIKTPEQALTIIAMGKALGIQPIVALNQINVIQGKPTIAPQLMLALIRRSGELQDMKVEDDGTTCTVTMTRKGESAHVETFGMEDAKSMQLAGKDNWQKQPKTMRKWRCIAAACRIVFPDVIWGMYTPEEMNPDIEGVIA